VVITDLAPGMAETVRQIWPESTLVADKFHVFQLFGKSLEATRKLTSASVSHQRGRHEQRLLHKVPDDLKPEEREELTDWLEKDPDLKALHGSLQSLRAVYRNPTPETGREALQKWFEEYQWSKSNAVKRIARTLLQWRNEIESYFHHRYTNARIEGTHNKIKVLKRRAYGYRNIQRFALRIRLECKAA
jgi:transposase